MDDATRVLQSGGGLAMGRRKVRPFVFTTVFVGGPLRGKTDHARAIMGELNAIVATVTC